MRVLNVGLLTTDIEGVLFVIFDIEVVLFLKIKKICDIVKKNLLSMNFNKSWLLLYYWRGVFGTYLNKLILIN